MTTYGIDLGTTFSAIAVLDPTGRPKILHNRDGEAITPSVALFQGDQVLVGSMAKRSAPMAPDDTVQFVKRFMGDPNWSHVDSAGTVRRAEEISALILRRLADDAELATGERVTDVVITVPAYFDDARRQATKDAGQLAGLEVVRLINEPTAAAIAYGAEHSDAGIILVYDLGGGTFDVTLLKRNGDELEVLATDGDRNLGGFDFDNALMSYVNEQVTGQGGPDLFDGGTTEADLREKSELAKRTLSSMPKASVFVSAGGKNFQIPVTREAFEEHTEDLLFRTQVLLESVIEDAKLTWDKVDRVLLVGGSTRMPMVTQLVERITGREPERGINPDEAVAMGAAIVAHLVSGSAGGLPAGAPTSYVDVTSQGLGIAALNDINRLENSVILSRNTKIPSRQEKTYSTVDQNQSSVLVQVTVGDDVDLDLVSIVNEKPMPLPEGLAKGTPIKVVMAYDIDGIVHLEASLPGRGKNGGDLFLGEIELDRPLNIDADELGRMKTSMQELTIG
jgi:molecular chaperone DnaK